MQASVTTMKSLGAYKCPRCMKWGFNDLNHDYLCNRCIGVLLVSYRDHPSIPFIFKNLESRGLTSLDNPATMTDDGITYEY